MVKQKFSKTFVKKLLARFAGSKNIYIINSFLSGYQNENKKKIIFFLEEDYQYSKNRITRKRLERKTLLEEIKKEKQEIENTNFLLEKLKKL
jgi:hypothetical protein